MITVEQLEEITGMTSESMERIVWSGWEEGEQLDDWDAWEPCGWPDLAESVVALAKDAVVAWYRLTWEGSGLVVARIGVLLGNRPHTPA